MSKKRRERERRSDLPADDHFVRIDLRIDGPEGSWASDVAIKEFADSRYGSFVLQQSELDGPLVYVREALLHAAKSALFLAIYDNGLISARPAWRREARHYGKLLTSLSYAKTKLKEDFEAIEREELHNLFEEEGKALDLIEALEVPVAQLHKRWLSFANSKPNRDPKSDFLAVRFVEEIRNAWHQLVVRREERARNKFLIKLAVAMWSDARFPFRSNDMEGWMTERFKRG